jgi:hypothetical protein
VEVLVDEEEVVRVVVEVRISVDMLPVAAVGVELGEL